MAVQPGIQQSMRSVELDNSVNPKAYSEPSQNLNVWLSSECAPETSRQKLFIFFPQKYK